MFFIKCFLFSAYLLIIKFSVTLKSIIIILVFPLIIILIFRCALFIIITNLFVKAILKYFFWLLLSEKFSSFPNFLKDVFFGYIGDYLSKILHIFYNYSRFYTYPLYKIVIIFIYSLLFNNSVLKVSSNNFIQKIFLGKY